MVCRRDSRLYLSAGSKLQRCDSKRRYIESRSSEFLRAACLAMRIICSTFLGTLISLVRKSNNAEKSALFSLSVADFFLEKNPKGILNIMMHQGHLLN